MFDAYGDWPPFPFMERKIAKVLILEEGLGTHRQAVEMLNKRLDKEIEFLQHPKDFDTKKNEADNTVHTTYG